MLHKVNLLLFFGFCNRLKIICTNPIRSQKPGKIISLILLFSAKYKYTNLLWSIYWLFRMYTIYIYIKPCCLPHKIYTNATRPQKVSTIFIIWACSKFGVKNWVINICLAYTQSHLHYTIFFNNNKISSLVHCNKLSLAERLKYD